MSNLKQNAAAETGFIDAAPVSRSKSIAVVAILIAIGAVLRMFSPNILGITPNFIIAMYCLAIVLLRPGIGGTLGIGFVAGAVCMIFSKSPIPMLNLITEPAGALACLLVVKMIPDLQKMKGYSFKPIVATLIGTLVSGAIYVVLNFHFALKMPMAAMQAAFVGVVVPMMFINAVMAQALYAPAKKFLRL
ncbi:tryptophan transporter [Desulfofalx alkaliphila]|uniref:tryptophan transporter n=1 Tax=Desulfofalx alkaliphila TaxID=105483 RepID=UPI0004E2578E|nr:tryptophan transporter [Desulfofalx alkaliphila]